MADFADPREQRRADFLAQTARIAFSELQRYFAGGKLILVDDQLDLVEVATQLAEDNKAQFETWLAEAQIRGVSDEQAMNWLADNSELWAVVADPWVLVQERRRGRPSTESL
jgi:hypothetical protein